MSRVEARAYLSPSLVLLAMDWDEGAKRNDFLGFAIKRTPGFFNYGTKIFEEFSWLPNRLGFNGPPPKGEPDFPSNIAPVQKFQWWDARIDGITPGQSIKYEISPVTGDYNSPTLEADFTKELTVALPPNVEFGIGTWFNRAVMSSQAFSRMLKEMNLNNEKPDEQQTLKLRRWLANGMEKPVPDFVENAGSIVGAIYHLTDDLWIIPALQNAMPDKKIQLIYDSHTSKNDGEVIPCPNDPAIKKLKKIKFFPRNKTNIMHNKFLVAGEKLTSASGQIPMQLTCGSANYTTEGLTSQANLIHTFESPELASLYFDRFKFISDNPSLAETKKETGWSKTCSVGDTSIRVFFSPEPGKPNESVSVSIETIVQKIHEAKSSVIFCLFMPTDKELRDACFAVGNTGKMMFGLVNRIAAEEPELKPTSTGKIPADQLAALEIYHRSKENKDVIGAEFFQKDTVPEGFEVERNLFPGAKYKKYPEVIIHHKFIVIDGETDNPIIYSGSANMSGNSVFKNDENLLELKGSSRLSSIYVAEFLRLYEHYRARAIQIKSAKDSNDGRGYKLALQKDSGWAAKYYKPGSPECKGRISMLSL